MTPTQEPLSPTQLLAAASSSLIANGFSEANNASLHGIDSGRHRIFEDPYCVVAVTVFESWAELQNGWIEAQSALVELISEYVPKNAPKSWDGYLVLFTPGLVPPTEKHHIEGIRYDTGRVRKLIATGEQLKEVSDVENALLPLLPLQDDIRSAASDGVLARLPELLENPALTRDAIKKVVDAFVSQEPLVEALHTYLWRSNET